MKKLSSLMAVAVVLAVATSPALAQRGQRQGFGGGFGASPVMLLGQKSVQDELKLTEEQVKKVTQLAEGQRGGGRGDFANLSREEIQKRMQERAQASQKAINEILKPEQSKRLNQITLQQRGATALSDAQVAEQLKLTAEQKQKVQAIQEDAQTAMRELFQGGGGNREELQKKMQDFRNSNNEKLMKVLTEEQKTKWKEMQGEPFKGQITFGPGRRGGGR
jgi:Spy/CpxP family protein refolding chaperone